MVLLPSLIHEQLERGEIVHGFGTSNPNRRYGRVALASSFQKTKDWESYGGTVAKKDNLSEVIERLHQGQYENTCKRCRLHR